MVDKVEVEPGVAVEALGDRFFYVESTSTSGQTSFQRVAVLLSSAEGQAATDVFVLTTVEPFQAPQHLSCLLSE